MKLADSDFIVVGKIGTTYGVHGWLKIHSYTEFRAGILEYAPLYLASDQQGPWSSVEVESGKIHSDTILIKFKHINNPEEARLLTGKLIGITRAQLPKLAKNEYYWSELEGLTVIDTKGQILGKVTHLMETGSNDVLVVKGDKEHAIPYLPGKVVLSVDLEKGEIHVDWELI